MATDDEHLDITSEPLIPSAAASPSSELIVSGGTGSDNQKTVRILFGCCNVYIRLPVPEAVRSGKLKAWRVHCVRCGRVTEVPV